MTGDSDKRCSFLLLQNEFLKQDEKTIYIEETATG